MSSYYCNDVALHLPDVQTVVDLSRHALEITTTDGAALSLVIERTKFDPDKGIAAAVEATIAERKRSQRGFEVISKTERAYPDVTGLEVCVTFVDKERGPQFAFEFHCAVGEIHLAYLCTCRVAHAATCEPWMQTMLAELTLPDPEE